MEENRTFLITGASGFIGRHLVGELVHLGASVYAHDRSGESPTHVRHIPIVGDLTAPGWTAHLPTRVDVVVHLAQSTRYREFPDGVLDMLRVNVDATVELLDWARTHGVSQFLFASTGNVYRPSAVLHSEDDPCHPTSMYAATKLSAEYLVQQYAGFFRTIIVRLFGVYGPGQRNMVVPNMVERVRMGREITLAQDIGLQFTPIYIADCVQMLRLLMGVSPQSTESEVYNIAGSEIITLFQLVVQIADNLHLSPNIRRTEDAPSYLLGSITRVYSCIDYMPRVSLAQGIAQSV